MAVKPDISIIIVNYNVKDFLLQCLRSIQTAQKALNVEVIIVDNNSTDGSVEFLKPMFPEYEFIDLEANIGFGKANNLAFEKARGRYILILNPDTILAEDTLEVMLKYMDNDPKAGIAGCKVLNDDGTFQLACRRGFPTPWASFCKLFGLQKLFPDSELFARYNQTFKSINETYYIDAVIGAFMFCRKEVIDATGGFDEDFFMYGEDLDLCYRAKQLGWEVAYVHSTSIIHFKGESTKRSTINEVKHFYSAMEIFARKHFGKSTLFLFFLKMGIYLRQAVAYASRYRTDILFIIMDLIAVNLAILIGTFIRYGELFRFPDYAYPTIFIVVSIVLFASLFSTGEYLENKPDLRKSLFGLLITFFIVSSLTYFFKDYAFSRGVLLLSIGLTMVYVIVSRAAYLVYEKIAGSESEKRVLLVGPASESANLVDELRNIEGRNIHVAGIVNDNKHEKTINIPKLGSTRELSAIITKNKIHEVIITDSRLSRSDIIATLHKISNPRARFHIANEYRELLTSKIINDISGDDRLLTKYNINILRYKFFKRSFDILISVIMLTAGLPFILLSRNKKKRVKDFLDILKSKKTLIGISANGSGRFSDKPVGLIDPSKISNSPGLDKKAIDRLNDYYLRNYSISLDIDIFLKYIFRDKSGF
ncbi:MAG: glycosyltransferase [Candidatus Kapaibacterium sp.]